MATYRELPAAEWPKLASTFGEYGALLPRTELARIFVAEAEGEIVAFLTLQLVPHMEPLWVHPRKRGKLMLTQLVKIAEGALEGSGYFAHTSEPRVGAMAAANGMTPVSGVMWQKDLGV